MFWCTEAVFQRVKGVSEVIPGYIDGKIQNPTYKEVCSGKTGHTEAVSISYDNSIISIIDLFLIFFNTHDPTTLNRQGNDFGTQYRSGIYYTENKQKDVAKKIINQLETEKLFNNKIITEVKKATQFYRAEEHINYYNLNPDQPYCNITINPKINKLKTYFKNYLSSKKS